MIPSAFEYVRPASLEEALVALAAGGEDPKIMAGGQSLLPIMRMRLGNPSTIIDLGGISELRGVRDDGDAIVIGAMTTHSDVLNDPLISEHAKLIQQATKTVADPAVRHRGTFGGALAHADPAGDLPAVAVALQAEFVLVGPNASRTVPASEFFVDYLETALNDNEVLTEIRIPKHPGWASSYEKFNRVAQAWAMVGVAALVRRENGPIVEARIGLTNMGPTPIRATAVEQALQGASDDDAVGQAASHAGEDASPSSDLNAQADYRTHLATVLTKRAVLSAVNG